MNTSARAAAYVPFAFLSACASVPLTVPAEKSELIWKSEAAELREHENRVYVTLKSGTVYEIHHDLYAMMNKMSEGQWRRLKRVKDFEEPLAWVDKDKNKLIDWRDVLPIMLSTELQQEARRKLRY